MAVTKMHNFLVELAVLLEKHDASIGWDCDDCSDMHGISGEGMVVTVGGVERWFASQWEIYASDIRESCDDSRG